MDAFVVLLDYGHQAKLWASWCQPALRYFFFLLCFIPSAQKTDSCGVNTIPTCPQLQLGLSPKVQWCLEVHKHQPQLWSRSSYDLLLPRPVAGFPQGAVPYTARHLWWAKPTLLLTGSFQGGSASSSLWHCLSTTLLCHFSIKLDWPKGNGSTEERVLFI